MLIGSFSFAAKSNINAMTKKSEKKTSTKMMFYKVYCNGVYTGAFTCDGCNTQAVGNAMCNG